MINQIRIGNFNHVVNYQSIYWIEEDLLKFVSPNHRGSVPLGDMEEREKEELLSQIKDLKKSLMNEEFDDEFMGMSRLDKVKKVRELYGLGLKEGIEFVDSGNYIPRKLKAVKLPYTNILYCEYPVKRIYIKWIYKVDGVFGMVPDYLIDQLDVEIIESGLDKNDFIPDVSYVDKWGQYYGKTDRLWLSMNEKFSITSWDENHPDEEWMEKNIIGTDENIAMCGYMYSIYCRGKRDGKEEMKKEMLNFLDS